ncbi:MAG TPA: hypothetical protein VJW23_04750, partial [Propionibacteriaceae bacterium]|nr:hypothetical protein [Propionibacteriaceae bacterium]
HLDSLLKEAGVGDRPNMRQSARTYLARGTADVQRSAAGKMIDRTVGLIAPEFLRYAMSVPDILAREKVGTHAIYDGYRQLNPQLAGMLEAHLRKQGISHLIPQDRLHTVIDDFLATKRQRLDLNTGLPETGMTGKISRYEPVWAADDLKAHLAQNLTRDLVTKPDPGQLNRALNDFQHTTKNEVRRVIDEADAQVDHALFSWRDTKGDEYLKKVFLFHYWSSRQGGFYVAEGIKRPYLVAAYGRMMAEMDQQAEELGAPDWMKGWFQFMNSPAGLSIWYSPFDTIGSLLTMADWQTGQDPSPYDDLTEIGKKWEAMPFMIHPGLTMVAYSIGLLGPDARAPALTGTETFATRAIDLLNLANGMDAGFMKPFNAMGIGVDASGNKIPLARRPLQDLYASVGNAISTALQPITHLAPVEVVPSTGTMDANIISIGEAEVRRMHPEWDDGSKNGQMWINRTVTDAIDDPGSDLYQSWYRQAAELPFELADGMPLAL